jgi:dienelactone hydrolase
MNFDQRLLRLFQRGVLLTALLVPFSGCGDEEATGDETGSDDNDDLTADEVDEVDEVDDSTTERLDSGKPAPKDSGTKADGGKDGATPRTDGGTPTVDAGRIDPSDSYQRGPAPTSASATAKGPYEVKTYTDGYRDGPKYADSTIHYPVDAEPPYTIMAIVPGFVSPQSSIQKWGPFLASHGIVTMTIGTNTPADQPPDREAALMDALKTLQEENTREGSPLKGKLDLSRQAVGGWSMGGGGTLLAAEHNPSLKAAMAICPWNPGYNYGKVKVPALFFAGTVDVLAGGQSQPFYQSIPESTPKLLWEVNGADHWYANDPAGQGGAVGRYGLSFVKVFLEGDERYRPFLKEKGPNASDFRTNM